MTTALIIWGIVASLGCAVGWYVAFGPGIKVDQTQIQNSHQYQIMNSGQATIIDGKDVYKNVRFILTNVDNPYQLFDSLSEFQKREAVITRDGGRYLFKIPLVDTDSRTNSSAYAVTNRTNY